MAIEVSTLHHFTIGCTVDELPPLLAFYTRTIGLKQGFRPALRHPGHWLYAGGEAILHLNALLATSHAQGAGPVDHVALKAHGLEATRQALRAAEVAFRETPLKGTSLHQVFLQDPLGLTVELNFDLAVENAAAEPAA
jgi:catechol 2,3-dioxygenase-like lactoylglutathione lyase family enzyme